MITLDSKRGCVVLSLRGTLTVQDLVTDLLLDPVPLDTWLPAPFLEARSATCTQAADCLPGVSCVHTICGLAKRLLRLGLMLGLDWEAHGAHRWQMTKARTMHHAYIQCS